MAPQATAPPHTNGDSENSRRPVKSEKSKKKGKDTYLSAARIIARCINLWCDVDKVIKIVHLLQEDEASKCGELDEDNAARVICEEYLAKVSEETQQISMHTYYKLIQIIPGLKSVIDDPAKSDELLSICAKINADIRSTRSSDATRLKPCIAQYCLPDPDDPSSLRPPIILTKGRAEMGLNHPILAWWLCLVDQLHVFDKNPEQARKDLASGIIPMEAEDFPALFFSGAMPGQHYDPESDDVLSGLFRSYFLIRVVRHIFLGPSFAIEPPDRKNRSCNAVLNDVTTIEAEHIAYICVQARFAVSSKEQWNELDGDLNYCDMYQAIIRFIKNAGDPEWTKDLLRWWNKEMFGNENGRGSSEKKVNKDGNSVPRVSTMERLQAQMKARLTGRPEDPFPLDPSLATPSSSSSGGSSARFATGSAGMSTARPSVEASTSSLPGPSSTRKLVPATPSYRPMVGATDPGSPLSDEDESIPLTPVTNIKQKQPARSAKASGKRPAAPTPDNDANGMTVDSHVTKRARRNRK